MSQETIIIDAIIRNERSRAYRAQLKQQKKFGRKIRKAAPIKSGLSQNNTGDLTDESYHKGDCGEASQELFSR